MDVFHVRYEAEGEAFPRGLSVLAIDKENAREKAMAYLMATEKTVKEMSIETLWTMAYDVLL